MTSDPKLNDNTAKRLVRRLSGMRDESAFTMLRNTALGGAAVCLAIVLQVVQMGASDVALLVSVWACALAMPFWVLLAFTVEYYIHLGPESFPYYCLNVQSLGMLLMFRLSGFPTVIAIGGVLYHMSPIALGVFAVALVAAVLIYLGFHGKLADWWYTPGQPGSRETEDK